MMKKMRCGVKGLLLFFMFFMFYSCYPERMENELPPKIVLGDSEGLYVTKIGKLFKIEPQYENIEDAVFAWKKDGKIVGLNKSLEITPDELGIEFYSLDVINPAGSDYAEFKVTIVKQTAPIIASELADITSANGIEVVYEPAVENSKGTTFKWFVNGEEFSSDSIFVFTPSKIDKYKVRLQVENEDGEDSGEFILNVVDPKDMPFKWTFDQTEFSLSSGRRIRINIYDIENDFNADYIWVLNGVEVQNSKEPFYIFNGEQEGEYKLVVTMRNSLSETSVITKELSIKVAGPEGTYRRAITDVSSEVWNKVYAFLAAPGQFVNEYYEVYTMEDAVKYAEDRLSQEQYVSLGAFGGYIVIGFDHSVANDGGYNIQIKGNSFKGSSEPGIVYVMQDENGDGLPNDTWYELKGSETLAPETYRDYSVTYYRPKAPGMPVQWTDNKGKKGQVDYLASFHKQDYYYPNWVQENSYVLRGTCLKSKVREVSPGYWSNDEYEWGYVDNFSSIDRLTDDINYNANANGNHFKISDAIDFEGKPIHLEYIDFIKVHTGVNVKAGWLGENSTEVFNVKDFNMFKNN